MRYLIGIVVFSGVCLGVTWQDVCNDWLEADSFADVDFDDIVNCRDFALVTTTGLKNDIGLSFIWRPESSSREMHGSIPIVTIYALDGSYIELSYDGLNTQFMLTNGAKEVAVACDSGWGFAENIKFAIAFDCFSTRLYIETTRQGILLDETENNIVLADSVWYLKFSANRDGFVKGLGAYGDIKFCDTPLLASDVGKIFDLRPDSGRPVQTYSISQMIFHRDSIRFDDDVKKYVKDEPLSRYMAVAERESLVCGPLAGGPIGVEGTRCYYIYGTKIYWTEDALTATKVLDISSNPDFAADYSIGYSYLQSGVILDDGSWVLSLRDSTNRRTKLYRRDSVTEVCTNVLSAPGGEFAPYSWHGIRGNEIIVGQYGQLHEANEANKVYYSDDWGATWSLICTLPKGEGQGYPRSYGSGFHIHTAVFHPDHTDIAYLSIGDFDDSHLHKLTCVNPADKKNAASWIDENTGHRIAPTSALSHNGKLYLGQDGSGDRSGTIAEYDPESNTLRNVLDLPQKMTSRGSGAPYSSGSDSNVYSMAHLNGVMYAAMYYKYGSETGGVYASIDGENWVRVLTTAEGVATGCRHIAGRGSDGRIWLKYLDGISTKVAYFQEPVIRNIPFIYAERGITNVLSADTSHFTESIGDWNPSHSYDSGLTGRSLEKALYDNASYRVVGNYNGFSSEIHLRMPLSATAGEYICTSLYLKLEDYLLNSNVNYEKPHIELQWYGMTSQICGNTGYCVKAVGDGWYRIRAWGQCLATWNNYINIRIRLFDYPQTDYSDVNFYIDCVQAVKFTDLHYSSAWQPGGTPRADEHLIVPILGTF